MSWSPPSARLPADWVQTKTSDGRVFFYNAVTRERSWSRPPATTTTTTTATIAAAEDDDTGSGSGTGSDERLPSGWAAYVDVRGREYYANKQTGERSWQRPQQPRAHEPEQREQRGAEAPREERKRQRRHRRATLPLSKAARAARRELAPVLHRALAGKGSGTDDAVALLRAALVGRCDDDDDDKDGERDERLTARVTRDPLALCRALHAAAVAAAAAASRSSTASAHGRMRHDDAVRAAQAAARDAVERDASDSNNNNNDNDNRGGDGGDGGAAGAQPAALQRGYWLLPTRAQRRAAVRDAQCMLRKQRRLQRRVHVLHARRALEREVLHATPDSPRHADASDSPAVCRARELDPAFAQGTLARARRLRARRLQPRTKSQQLPLQSQTTSRKPASMERVRISRPVRMLLAELDALYRGGRLRLTPDTQWRGEVECMVSSASRSAPEARRAFDAWKAQRNALPRATEAAAAERRRSSTQ